MTRRARFVLVLSVLLTCSLGSVLTAAPATATVTTLCTGYSGCHSAGMSASGYAKVSGTAYWRMYTGHNCTNYAAYRMVKSGLANVRPWTGGGNATYWGTSMGEITDATPMVGAVAWWKAGVSPAGSAGHVAYVERVISADEIIVSQDSWGGDFSWARVTRATRGWPSGFIHFNDVPLTSVALPVVQGQAKVGGMLTATSGTWQPSDAAVRYQWRADGAAIRGATAPELTLATAQLGKTISVRVTASELGYPTTRVVSASTSVVQPGVISNTTRPTVTGEAVVDATLTADPGTWSPTPDSVSYQWLADGQPLDGAATQELSVDPGLVGKTLAVVVTATKDGYADVTAASETTAPVVEGTLTLTSPPIVTGTPLPGRRLTLTLPAVTPAASSSVQWLRAGVPVAGATGPTYRLTADDLGARISARVRLTRPGYSPLKIRSAATPRVRSRPSITLGLTPGHHQLAVRGTVTAYGVAPVAGVLRIQARGHLLAEAPLRAGTAVARLTGLPAGQWTVRIVFPGTPTVARAVLQRRVTIL